MKATTKIGAIHHAGKRYTPIEDSIHLSDYVEFLIGKRVIAQLPPLGIATIRKYRSVEGCKTFLT